MYVVNERSILRAVLQQKCDQLTSALAKECTYGEVTPTKQWLTSVA